MTKFHWRSAVSIMLAGEVGATLVSFGLNTFFRLASSLTLTRLLTPTDFGKMVLITTVLFALEMIGDFAFHVVVIRDRRGDDPKFLNVLWTMKLARSVVVILVLLVCAPAFASWLGQPDMTDNLRLSALFVLFGGLETFGFQLAIRNHRSRIQNYTETATSAVSTLFSVAYCYVFGGYVGMLYGLILGRFIGCVSSYVIVKGHQRPQLSLDKAVLSYMFGYARSTFPSGLITLGMSQMDKLFIGKLLPLSSLGLYGLAGNLNLAEAVNGKLAGMVVFSRFATALREEGKHTQARLHGKVRMPARLMVAAPILVGTQADLIVSTLYDHRYHEAAVALAALSVRSFLLAWSALSDRLLLAAGIDKVQYVPSLLRIASIALFGYTGYHLHGFEGFLFAIAIEPFPALIYLKTVQSRLQLLDAEFDRNLLAWSAGILGLSIAFHGLVNSMRP